MKRKIITYFLLLVALGLGLAFFWVKKVPEKPVVIPTTTIAPINPATLPVSLSNAIEAYNNVPVLTFPTTLPLYSVNQNKTVQGEFTRLSTVLDINQGPQEINGSRGRYFMGRGDKSSLIVSENPLSMGYTQNASSSARITYDIRMAEKNAQEKIVSIFVLNAPVAAKNPTSEYFTYSDTHPEPVNNPSVAFVHQISFDLFVDEFPLFTGDAKLPGISARLNGDQALTELHGFLLPEIQKQSKTMQIASYDTAVLRLQANQGVLSRITTNDKGDQFLTGETPKIVDVAAVTLGYLLVSGRDTLVPVFVFNGTGYLEKERREVDTTTIVSAIP